LFRISSKKSDNLQFIT